ncbi:hypothetical protein CE91St46_14150 [Eubacteriales bacterium]|mgnify:FL=1|nr:hypothetical protein CE91St46_14150 [Eubacteriales bacterium]GKH62941.1 hypothetical protein CE91St47_14100 [Eubacteriales bacterium]
MSADPREAFPKALQYYMNLNGKRQQDLIKDLGISSATLSQWVNGKMFPRMDKVEKLAEYFRITTTDLLTDPYQKKQSTSDPLIVAKLLESSPLLSDLLSLLIRLEEADLAAIKGIAERFLQLQNRGEEL